MWDLFFNTLYTMLDVVNASKSLHIEFDICISQGVYECLIGLVLRYLGVFRKVVFFAVDWFPRKSVNAGLLSAIDSILFPQLDRTCEALADRSWSFTQRILAARASYRKKPSQRESVVVPPILRTANSVDRNSETTVFGYVGALTPGRGVDKSIRLISRLRTRGIDARLEVIGAGTAEYVSVLRNIVQREELESHVEFLGERTATGLIGDWKFGLALYDVDHLNHSYYAWPLKIMLYLENRVPIITTKQASVVDEIVSFNAGIVMEDAYDLDDLAATVVESLRNPAAIESFQQGVLRLLMKYSEGTIVESEIENLLGD